MKCPHCTEKISFFSKALNSWGKDKHCPHCHQAVRNRINFKRFLILLVPAAIAAQVLNALGLNMVCANALIAGLPTIFSMQLEAD